MINEFWNGIYKIILCKGNLLSEEMCTILILKKAALQKIRNDRSMFRKRAV